VTYIADGRLFQRKVAVISHSVSRRWLKCILHMCPYCGQTCDVFGHPKCRWFAILAPHKSEQLLNVSHVTYNGGKFTQPPKEKSGCNDWFQCGNCNKVLPSLILWTKHVMMYYFCALFNKCRCVVAYQSKHVDTARTIASLQALVVNVTIKAL